MSVRAIVLAGVLGLAIAGAAWGQAQPQQMQGEHPAVRRACAADVRTLCPSAQPGSGQIRECLRQNAAKVSAPCKEALMEARAEKKGGGSGSP